MRLILPAVCLCASLFTAFANDDLASLHQQLKRAAVDDPSRALIAKRIVQADPADQQAWETLVETSANMRQLARASDALDDWQKAANGHPPLILKWRGEVAYRQPKHREKNDAIAAKYFEAYIATQPAPNEIFHYDRVLAKICALNKSDPDREKNALQFLNHALALKSAEISDADRADAFMERAKTCFRLRDFDAALADAQSANRLDASGYEVKHGLPLFDRFRNDRAQFQKLDQEIANADQAKHREMAVSGLLARSRLFAEIGAPELSLEDAQRAFHLAPESMAARVQLGAAFLNLGKLDEMAALKVSHDLPMDSKTNGVKTDLWDPLVNTNAALAANHERADLWANRAAMLNALQQFLLAKNDAQNALKRDAHSANVELQLATALAGLQETRLALIHTKTALQLDRRNGAAWALLGKLEIKKALYRDAAESLSRAIAHAPAIDLLKLREDCWRRIGRVRDANADLRRIEKLTPSN